MASKVKVFTIASLALNVAVAGLLVMQKGNYVSQAEEAYQKKTNAYYKQATNIVEGQNSVIENNAVLWNLARGRAWRDLPHRAAACGYGL